MEPAIFIADLLIRNQWHLVNTKIPQNTINVTGLWKEGITGKGVKVCVVDDGLDMHSDDLAANFVRHTSVLVCTFDVLFLPS